MMADPTVCGGAEELLTAWDRDLKKVRTRLRAHEEAVQTIKSSVHGVFAGMIASGS